MSSTILRIDRLASPWQTIDPFLVCAHHVDHYPAGNAALGPNATATEQDSWSMYFGHSVPGFPAHPHRGFETITILRKGVVDHSDSLGASARFAAGDVQWLTAGRGIVHAEMFPLLEPDDPNPLELFQIWLNLPAHHKMVQPHFTMLWAEDIPRQPIHSAEGRTELVCIAGIPPLAGMHAPPAPPPNSWATDPAADLAIWTVKMSAGARWTLPPAKGHGTRRQLCFFQGATLTIDGQIVPQTSAIEVQCSQPVEIINGAEPSELLVLQARPLGEPVVQDGPFVMNSASEIQQAYADYRQTQFGHWAWPSKAPVHGSEKRRFVSR